MSREDTRRRKSPRQCRLRTRAILDRGHRTSHRTCGCGPRGSPGPLPGSEIEDPLLCEAFEYAAVLAVHFFERLLQFPLAPAIAHRRHHQDIAVGGDLQGSLLIDAELL